MIIIFRIFQPYPDKNALVFFFYGDLIYSLYILVILDMKYLSALLWFLIINMFPSRFPQSHARFKASQLVFVFCGAAMAFSCSFQSRAGTNCSYDRLDKSKSLEIISLRNCSKNITDHCSHWSFYGVTTESELVLARVGVFSEEEISAQRLDTICPYQRRELGLGWRRNSTKCCVPQILSKHGPNRKADRGVSKILSERIVKETGLLFPVGSGRLCFKVKTVVMFELQHLFL